MRLSINPRMAELPFDKFKRWLKSHFPGEDAAIWYEKIGGKIPKKKKGAVS